MIYLSSQLQDVKSVLIDLCSWWSWFFFMSILWASQFLNLSMKFEPLRRSCIICTVQLIQHLTEQSNSYILTYLSRLSILTLQVMCLSWIDISIFLLQKLLRRSTLLICKLSRATLVDLKRLQNIFCLILSVLILAKECTKYMIVIIEDCLKKTTAWVDIISRLNNMSSVLISVILRFTSARLS